MVTRSPRSPGRSASSRCAYVRESLLERLLPGSLAAKALYGVGALAVGMLLWRPAPSQPPAPASGSSPPAYGEADPQAARAEAPSPSTRLALQDREPRELYHVPAQLGHVASAAFSSGASAALAGSCSAQSPREALVAIVPAKDSYVPLETIAFSDSVFSRGDEAARLAAQGYEVALCHCHPGSVTDGKAEESPHAYSLMRPSGSDLTQAIVDAGKAYAADPQARPRFCISADLGEPEGFAGSARTGVLVFAPKPDLDARIRETVSGVGAQSPELEGRLRALAREELESAYHFESLEAMRMAASVPLASFFETATQYARSRFVTEAYFFDR